MSKEQISPKKKATQLIRKFTDIVACDYRGDEKPFFELQQLAATIVVNEILKTMSAKNEYGKGNEDYEYWVEVKKEINNR